MDYEIPEEVKIIVHTTKEFVKRELDPIADKVEKEGKIPEEIVREMRELGYFGLRIPEDFGGGGLSTLGYIMVLEELSKPHKAFWSLIYVNNGIGFQTIWGDGTENQKERFLPPLARGDKIAAFALTETEAGSDAASIRTSAVLRGDRFVLNGVKHFITNGPIADIAITMAVTDRNKGAGAGITAFIVEKGMPGFSVGQIHETLGDSATLQSELVFENCEVPVTNVVGQIGMGFKTAMKFLDDGRLTMAACVIGPAQRLLELSVDYSKQRITFGKPIAERQAIQWMIADMATEIFAAREMLYRAAWEKDRNKKVSVEASMVKLFATEAAFRIADRAVQIHGSMGYAKDYPVERWYRDLRSARITEGPSEIQRIVIARKVLGI
jgi:acyl-CoA dehydrogenase